MKPFKIFYLLFWVVLVFWGSLKLFHFWEDFFIFQLEEFSGFIWYSNDLNIKRVMWNVVSIVVEIGFLWKKNKRKECYVWLEMLDIDDHDPSLDLKEPSLFSSGDAMVVYQLQDFEFLSLLWFLTLFRTELCK